jgi:hypothetical protein
LHKQRDALRKAISARLTADQAAEYLEVSRDQFLELTRPNATKRNPPEESGG